MTIASTLLCMEDGEQRFVHDTFEEFFLARWFADQINNGELTVGEAWNDYLSYQEDKKIWGLEDLTDKECRAFRPEIKNTLVFLVGMMDEEKSTEIIDTLSKGYLKAEEKLDDYGYNPFFNNLILASNLVKESGIEEGFDQITDALIKKIKLKLVKRDEKPILFAISDIGSKKAIDFLEEHLKDNDNSVNNYAYPALTKHVDKEGIFDILTHSLLYQDRGRGEIDYLQRGIKASSKMHGQINKFIDLFNKSDNNKKHIIAKILRLNGSDKALDFLMDYVSNTENKDRGLFLDYLDCKKDKVIDFLMDYISNPKNPDVRLALSSLSKIGTQKAANKVMEYFFNSDPGEYFRHTLMELTKHDISLPEDKLIEYIQDSSNEYFDTIVEILGIIKSKKAVDTLLKYLEDEDNKYRFKIIESLGNIGDERAVPTLIDILSKYTGCDDSDDGFYAGWYTSKALGNIGDERAIESLVRYISDTSGMVKDHGRDALVKIGGNKTIELLTENINSEEISARTYSAEVLARLRYYHPIMDDLIKDRREWVRSSISKAVINIEGDKTIKMLSEYSTNPKNSDRGNTIYLLKKKDKEKAIEYLIPYLENPDEKRQFYAAKVLASLNYEKSLRLLEPLLDEPKKRWVSYCDDLFKKKHIIESISSIEKLESLEIINKFYKKVLNNPPEEEIPRTIWRDNLKDIYYIMKKLHQRINSKLYEMDDKKK